jgi:arylsulfatase A
MRPFQLPQALWHSKQMISRRDFLAGASAAMAAPVFAASKLPNIVVMLADDLGYGDPHCYNPESRIPTPNLDRLAAAGVRFTDAHTPSAVCTPTRYGLLTGRYCWRTRLTQGVLDGFDPPLIEKARMTVASLLNRQGYSTACVGKWHLGMQWTNRDGTPVPFRQSFQGEFRPGYDVDYSRPATGGPNDAGFDWYFGISASLDMSPYCFIENGRTAGIPDVRTSEDKTLFMNQVPGVRVRGFELKDVLPVCTRKATEYIGKQKGAKTPFFLYVPFSAPHLPIVPNKEFEGRSKAGRYGDFVAEMDASAGAILHALEKTGLAGNTLVIFTSDNGGLWHWWDFKEADDIAYGRISPRGKEEKSYGHQSNGPLRGTKADIWEGGHRVPFIARWPSRIKPGSVSDELISLVDLMATCADITGAKLPDNAAEDSFSILPALLGRKSAAPVRDHVVYHSLRGEFSIEQGDWKLMLHRGSGGFSTPREVQPKPGEPVGQLYNIRQDLQETRNVYSGHPEVVERLTRLLEKVQRQDRSRMR